MKLKYQNIENKIEFICLIIYKKYNQNEASILIKMAEQVWTDEI